MRGQRLLTHSLYMVSLYMFSIFDKFIGFVGELHITPTKRWAALPVKNCMVCGVEYVSGSGASRYKNGIPENAEINEGACKV